MVLVPHDTLAQLQAARLLEQTPTTRVVHGLDDDMKKLLERQDVTDEDKIKLYNQTLRRYTILNRQRSAPLTMNLQTSTEDATDRPPKLEQMLASEPPKLDREPGAQLPTKVKAELKESSGESYGLPQLYAQATHLASPQFQGKEKKKKKRRKTTSKCSQY